MNRRIFRGVATECHQAAVTTEIVGNPFVIFDVLRCRGIDCNPTDRVDELVLCWPRIARRRILRFQRRNRRTAHGWSNLWSGPRTSATTQECQHARNGHESDLTGCLGTCVWAGRCDETCELGLVDPAHTHNVAESFRLA